MGIDKLRLTNLTNNSHFQFGVEFNTLVTKTGATALIIVLVAMTGYSKKTEIEDW